ncbi:DUF4373 domain-containing protein [Paenibacillus bouchesdurhonensis]|uniref:DUF4373 domain-containing protein n=1 Tax=Paenibacillus bouchesdurhonensis TaxID=1870990 RepID=UPI000DA60B3D|nr:DUF4373 domain-containing protein [Paenibacillus bouchesdurhonensis]
MKEAYYFSHDSNARHDPKITAMRGVYGSEGYGWYWMLVEMMRESQGYKLDMHSKYTFNAFALQLQTDSTKVEQFVHDCIHEFELFEADETHFWSASLLRRMDIREQLSEARRKAAKARWNKGKQPTSDGEENAEGMQMHSNSSANGMQGKESKLNKSKRKESNKDIYTPEFESFWTEYPRKIEKQDAAKTFNKIVKEGEDHAVIIQCAKNYKAECKRLKTEQRYIKHAKTFLNEGRYKDYLEGGAGVGELQRSDEGVQSGGYQEESEFDFLDRQNRTGTH